MRKLAVIYSPAPDDVSTFVSTYNTVRNAPRSEFYLGLAEITRNDVYHNNRVELGVDVEYVVVHRSPILLFDSGAETHGNPRPTARTQNKRHVPPTNASSAWCSSTFLIWV